MFSRKYVKRFSGCVKCVLFFSELILLRKYALDILWVSLHDKKHLHFRGSVLETTIFCHNIS